jgi:hypothetical protein
MRKLLVVLLTLAVIVGGCGRSSDMTSNGKVSGSTIANDTFHPAPHDGQALAFPPVDAPVPCRQGTPLTKDEMTDLLVRVSMYAPLVHLTGPALEIEQQWLEMESKGWPEESNTWVGHAWSALNIAKGSDETYVVQLQNGGEYSIDYDKFMVVCIANIWQVKQFARGLDGPWLEPARELPGQRGALTPKLVTELVKVAQRSRGPWFAQVATGNALEWERVDEVTRARGRKPLPMQWGKMSDQMALSQLDETHADARFPGSANLALRLEKVDGLWMIENYTEGGDWLPSPSAERISTPGLVFDPPFEVVLGKTDTTIIEHSFGSPDSVKTTDLGKVYSYNRRQIEVRFDSRGKVSAFSMKTGASNSGVRIGSPVALWELIYGPPDTSATTSNEQLLYNAQDGKVAEITWTAGRQ